MMITQSNTINRTQAALYALREGYAPLNPEKSSITFVIVKLRILQKKTAIKAVFLFEEKSIN
jgi:hypothetical protein